MKLISGQPCRVKAADSACHCVMQLAVLLCHAVHFGRIDGCQAVGGGGEIAASFHDICHLFYSEKGDRNFHRSTFTSLVCSVYESCASNSLERTTNALQICACDCIRCFAHSYGHLQG